MIESDIKRVYFLGIGGIGMSALARYFRAEGKLVAGYDRTPTQLTAALQEEGIAVHYDDMPALISPEFLSPDGTLVVYTPAVPSGLKEMTFLKDIHPSLYKRSQVLGMLSAMKQTVAVAGTHGKTTVSTMLAYILSDTAQGCNAFLGGISKNLNSNLIYRPDSHLMVTEADEFDRSFLQLHPHAAIVTAMDPDHLDIYGNARDMEQAYQDFATQVEEQGILLIKKGIPIYKHGEGARTYTYSLNGKDDFHAMNIRLRDYHYVFDLSTPQSVISDVSLSHPGILNVENAVAAAAMATLLGTGPDIIRKALGNFTGIQRRFDFRILRKDFVYVDDYGHHPMEINAALSSLRALFPGRRITGVFQPHLFTRTRDFAEGFAESLGLLDELILLDIYPAREEPIAGVTSEIIFRHVRLERKIMCKDEELLEELKKRDLDVLVTMGAGNIDRFVEPIRQQYLQRN